MNNNTPVFSITPGANKVPKANGTGSITQWIENDPIINSLKSQNEFLGTCTAQTDTEAQLQSALTAYVESVASREPRKGDLVNIENSSIYTNQQWYYNVTKWIFYISFSVPEATSTVKGILSVNTNAPSRLSITNGVLSSGCAKIVVTNPSITPSGNTATWQIATSSYGLNTSEVIVQIDLITTEGADTYYSAVANADINKYSNKVVISWKTADNTVIPANTIRAVILA